MLDLVLVWSPGRYRQLWHCHITDTHTVRTLIRVWTVECPRDNRYTVMLCDAGLGTQIVTCRTHQTDNIEQSPRSSSPLHHPLPPSLLARISSLQTFNLTMASCCNYNCSINCKNTPVTLENFRPLNQHWIRLFPIVSKVKNKILFTHKLISIILGGLAIIQMTGWSVKTWTCQPVSRPPHSSLLISSPDFPSVPSPLPLAELFNTSALSQSEEISMWL